VHHLTLIGWFIGSREDVILEVLNQEGEALRRARPCSSCCRLLASVAQSTSGGTAGARRRTGKGNAYVAAMRFVVHGRSKGWVPLVGVRQATRLGLPGSPAISATDRRVIVEGSDSGLVELERLLAQGPPRLRDRVEKSQVPHEVLHPERL